MKFAIILSKEEVKGIKSYLAEADGISTHLVTKDDIMNYVNSIVNGTLENPREAVYDHIQNAKAEGI